jgi:hypothetical protein
MKFRFPIVIIDEDFRSENSSGLGIRVLAKAIEEEGFEVLVIWDSEYRWGNKQEIINKCVAFLNKK